MLVAVSRIIKNKPSTADFKSKEKRLNATFENLDLTAEELGNEVAQGHAFCAQHGNKWRNKEHFLRAGFLAVDIDDGMRIEDALKRPFVEEFGALIYTSPSHTPEDHRFRIVFELEEPITDMLTMERAYTGLIRKFGADKSCKDACRMFYGSEGAKVYLIGGSKLPKQEVNSLVIRGQEILFTKATLSQSTERTATVHSRLQIDPEIMVTSASGVCQRLVDFPADTPIHCPVHQDRHPSAFTLKSKSGTPGIHCITCQATYFIRSEGPYYDFDYELLVLQRLRPRPTLHSIVRKLDKQEQIEEVAIATVSGTTAPVQRELLSVADTSWNTGVAFISEPFLPAVQTDADVVLVKSPKGSGKTEWLKEVVLDAKTQRQSVLLIGHRQSLIMATAERLGLTPYIKIATDDQSGESQVVHQRPDAYFAICVDSLPIRLDPRKHKYDIVLIDEVEQVLAHLTAETLRDNRHDALMLLSHYLQRSKKIYALDADLNRVTGISIPELLGRSSKKTAFVVVNDWRSSKGAMSLYEDRAHLIRVLRDHVAVGKRCFVCANSKAMVRRLTHMLNDEFGGRKKLKTITSDNSQTKEVQDFLLELPDTCLDYDCVLVSPAVGTGVDITFPNNESKIDAVFGFFGARVNTHFDIDQQLCRVRHPGAVHVWVSPEKFSFSTYHKVIRTELQQTAQIAFRKIGYEDDGTPKYSDADRLYATIFSEVTALRRASKNNFLENFSELRRRGGWDIVTVPRDEAASEVGKELHETAVTLDEAARTDRVLQAPPISDSDYKTLIHKSKRGSLSSDGEAKMRRHEIERFYLSPISKDLVEQDDNGAHRDQIRMFELLESADEDLDRWWLHLQRETRVHQVMNVDVNEARGRRRVLVKLFAAAGIYEPGTGFNTETVLIQDGLADFTRACREEKVAIERLLEISLRRDIGSKANRQLGEFLKLIGLSLAKAGSRKEGDSKIYLYRVDANKLARVRAEADRRKDPSAKAEWAALQEQRFPDDPDFDLSALRQHNGLHETADELDVSSSDPEDDELDRIQRDLDRKAERYREAPEEAPTEPEF